MASLVDRPVELIHIHGFTAIPGKAFPSKDESERVQRQTMMANGGDMRLVFVKHADGKITAEACEKIVGVRNGLLSKAHQKSIHKVEHGSQSCGQLPFRPQSLSGIPSGVEGHQNNHEHVAVDGSRTDGSGTEKGSSDPSDIPIQSYRTREVGDEYFDFDEDYDQGEDGGDAGGDGAGDGDGDDGYEEIETEPESDSESDDEPYFGVYPPMPTRDGVPMIWLRHHDLLTWSFRGSVEDIKGNLQFLFGFSPPLSDEFILSRLNGRFAEMHLEFLLEHLPGETGTIQRARDRIEIYERGTTDEAVYRGEQTIVTQPRHYGDPEYQVPPLPTNAPEDWNRHHDIMLNIYMSKSPGEFIEDCDNLLANSAPMEFLQVRLAQTIHLGITMNEIQDTLEHVRHDVDLLNEAA